MLVKCKATNFIIRVIAGSSHPILVNSWLSKVKYPAINKIWIIFDNNNSTQYPKNIAIYEEYTHLVKYFYGKLVLLVYRLHFPEIIVIFCITFLAWYNLVNLKIQNDMEVKLESAANWANHEVIKKICTYSYT